MDRNEREMAIERLAIFLRERIERTVRYGKNGFAVDTAMATCHTNEEALRELLNREIPQ